MSRLKVPVEERFLSKFRVGFDSGCWEWVASFGTGGYGQIGDDKGRPIGAHRVSYNIFKGEIPDGLVVDHICRNRVCVNPAHLRLLTRGENVMCGETVAAIKAAASKCPNGHEYVEENIYRYGGHRHCRECRKKNDGLRKNRAARGSPCEV